MTDADRLSTPTNLGDTLRSLTRILRDVETFPAAAQQRFWDELDMAVDDLRIGADVSLQTVSVLYRVMVTMCGPRLNEMVTGDVKEYYEGMIAQIKEAAFREWDAFLDQKLAQEDSLAIESLTLDSGIRLDSGVLRRAEGIPKLLIWTGANEQRRYFASKDIIMLAL